MRNVLFRFAVTCLILTSPLLLEAQNISGIWRGHFTSEYGDQYRIEIQVKQSPMNSINGVTYSYLSTVFYGKATATGFVKKAEKKVLLQEIKTVELKMGSGSVACIMKYNLNYIRSGREEFLEGTYTSTYEKTSFGSRKGDDCGGGTVYLRKVPTSDFYVEPFLKSNPVTKKSPPPANTTVKAAPAPKPPANNTTAKRPAPRTAPPPAQVKKVTPPATRQTEIARTDTVKKKPETTIEQPKTERPRISLPAVTRSRNNELTQTFVVRNETVIVKLYDNGEVDGDTITVYLDGQPVLSNKMLSTTPLTLTLKMSEDNAEHVLVMVAENLGRIPPNTSLMIVQDGDKRYEARITSTEQKNAMVRFRYQKQP